MTSAGVDLHHQKSIDCEYQPLTSFSRTQTLNNLTDKHAASWSCSWHLNRRARRPIQARRKHPRSAETNELQPFDWYWWELHSARSFRRYLVEQPYCGCQYSARYATGGYLSPPTHD